MADIKKSLPEVGARIETPRFLTVHIKEVFDSYDDMVHAGYTEPTHYRGDFWVNGKSIDEYHMHFACSPNPDWYRASAKKFASFSDMVKNQRNSNKGIGKWSPPTDLLAMPQNDREELLKCIDDFIYHVVDMMFASVDERIKQAYNLLLNVQEDLSYYRGTHREDYGY